MSNSYIILFTNYRRCKTMGISTLLLNTFIIIICILSYHVFWLEFKEKITCNNMLFSILSSIAIIFCMTFPFHLHVGFIYDLRFIPIILVFLYGNTKTLFYRNFISFLSVLLRRKWRSSIIYYLHYYFWYNNALSLLITYVC